jgi:hypothetical protein
MATVSGLSLSGALIIATANKTRNANSVCHLFKSTFLPSPTSVKADFLAAECDFDGYAPLTIAAWGDPILFGQGYATFAPTQTFRWTHDTDDVGNSVGGYFLVDSGGNLLSYATFNPPANVSGPGQAVVVTPIMVTPAGPF